MLPNNWQSEIGNPHSFSDTIVPVPEPDRPGFVIHLKDSAPVFLGPIRPEDAWRLRDGLARMSGQSRYLRFFSGFAEFSPAQVRYFTEVDQVNHVAWGAMDASSPDLPGAGIGRFAIDPNDPTRAEWAITIVDDWQRRGLGTILMAILYLEASTRDVQTLTAFVLPENRQVLDWFAQLGAQITPQTEAIQIDLPITPDSPQLARTSAGQNLLNQMAALKDKVQNAKRRSEAKKRS